MVRRLIEFWQQLNYDELTAEDRAALLGSLVGPPRYVRTQGPEPLKARLTWERAVSVYLETRRHAPELA